MLGDAVEHAGLEFALTDGTARKVLWEASSVFEDTEPRLVDVDGDGAPEVIAVESHEREGARLTIWGLEASQPRLIAATPFIGARFRWLAVVGAADLDGDGAVEIAYVDRPHLAKVLRDLALRAAGDAAGEVATMRGVTNHRVGETDIAGGVRDCGAGPEIVVAAADWSEMLAVRLDGALSVRGDRRGHVPPRLRRGAPLRSVGRTGLGELKPPSPGPARGAAPRAPRDISVRMRGTADGQAAPPSRIGDSGWGTSSGRWRIGMERSFRGSSAADAPPPRSGAELRSKRRPAQPDEAPKGVRGRAGALPLPRGATADVAPAPPARPVDRVGERIGAGSRCA